MGKETELLLAAQTGNVPHIEKLLQVKKAGIASFRSKGVNPNCQDDSGYTPLHHAALNGHKEAVHVLLDYNASNHIPDSTGSYPLHLAAWKGDVDIARLLIHRGPSKAGVNEQNCDGGTALHSAAQYGHNGVVSLLLESGADATLRNTKDESSLDLGAQYDRTECVKLLLAHQPSLVLQNSKRHTPIHLAARNGHKKMVALLLEHGMDANLKTHNGSCLHEASLFGRVEVVQLLIEADIDISITTSSGNTAVDILEGHNSQKAAEIRKLLQDHAMKQGLKRHSMQSEAHLEQSSHLMDFGDPVAANGTVSDVSHHEEGQVDPFGPIPAPRSATHSATSTMDQFLADYALLGEDVPTASSTAPLPKPRVRTKSVPPIARSVELSMHSQRSMSQSPTHTESNYSLLLADSSSLAWHDAQIIPRSMTTDSRGSTKSDNPPALPKKIRQTAPAKPMRQFGYGDEERTKSTSPDVSVGSSEELSEHPKSSTNPFSPTSPYVGLDRSPSESDPFGQLEETGSSTTGTPSKERAFSSAHLKFAGLHLGGRIETADVPNDLYIAKVSVSGDELESDEDEWAQVEKLLVSVDDVTGGLAETPDMPMSPQRDTSEPLAKSIGNLTSVFEGQTGKLESIDEFLETYTGLVHYADLMVANGFDQVQFLGSGLLQESDLETIGIGHEGDRRKIMLAVESLPSVYQTALPNSADSLGAWLSDLKLAQYTALFIQHGFTSLDSVKGLYGLELDKVLPIHCLGHTRRLSVAIGSLKGVKKTSPSPVLTASSDDQNELEEFLDDAEPRPDSLATDVRRDYSQITSKASPQLPAKQSSQDHQFGVPDPDAALGAHGDERPGGRDSSDLPTVRPPRIAQIESRRKVGRLNEETHLTSSDKWCHPVDVILKSSANYVAKYLGSMLVTEVQGIQSTKAACAKMRESTKHMKKMPLIVLALSAKGIKFIDGDSKMVIQEHDIRSVSYCSQDREDLRTFAYINRDHVTGKHYCHVFQSQTTALADEIILTIGQAFEVAFQKIMQEKARRDAAKFEAELENRKGRQGSVKAASRGSQSQAVSALGLGPTKTL